MNTKQKFHIKNWHDYNEALVRRGSLTVWFDEASIRQWHKVKKTGKAGHPYHYSDLAIRCALTLRAVYRLPLRATEGLLHSLIKLLHKQIDCPNYTVLCRRQRKMRLKVSPPRKSDEPLHIVVDATGVKVYGEGEWKTKQYGLSKRKKWRKLHIAVDAKREIIEAAVVTTENLHDSEVLNELLDPLSVPIAQVTGDGAYDADNNYRTISAKGAKAVIPPRRNAKIIQHGNCHAPPLPRDENLRAIRKIGRKKWKIINNYHQRSLVETTVFRLKTLFGCNLKARKFIHQAVELFIACRALNKMTLLGMPQSYAVV